MRILAVDYGDARTGLASCDKYESIASPYGVIFEWNFEKCLQKVVNAVKETEAEQILVGLPINMDGSQGARAQKCREFAEKIGVNQMATHVGFLPENAYDENFRGTIATLRGICKVMKKRGQYFLFETGQETPVTLLRVIEELDAENVGINMDTANLILYGKANSADAITVFGKYVMDTHIKDGLYPTNGKKLGKEVKVGEGMANLPEVIKRLREVGYTGNYIIEREIKGEQQTKDIIDTLAYLKKILN